jgi:asparagine synthetase B (glutamine-hydrolysing)
MARLSPSAWTMEIQEDGADRSDPYSGPPACVHRDGNIVVAFGGSLANGPEIDSLLGPSATDAERVARAYRRHDARLTSLLKGFFAFVIHDRGAATTLAVRDRVGIVPLFVARGGRARVFSPSFARLRQHDGVPRAPNRLLIAQHLADQWGDARVTHASAIERVPPATILSFSAGRPEVATSYWNPSGLRQGETASEVAAALHSKLESAIRHALSLGRAGVFLSGGVDSISVAAIAARTAESLKAHVPSGLSLYFRGSEMDEEAIQKSVAAMLRLPQVGIGLDEALDGGTAMAKMLAVSRRWPVPMGNVWLPAFLRLGQRGRENGADVILTGGGGDEWLGVGPFLGADLLRQRRLLAFARFLSFVRRSYGTSWSGLLHIFVWRFGVKQLVVSARNHLLPALGHDLDASRARRGLPDWLVPDCQLRAELVDCLTMARRCERLARNAAPSLYDHEAQRGLWHPVVQAEVENKTWMSEAIGARVLEPYWDADVVELLYRTPPAILSEGGLAKGILHHLLREVSPGFAIPRQNKGALAPLYVNRVGPEAGNAWRAMGGVPALADLGLVEPGRLEARVQQILRGARPPRELWLIPHVLSVEAWVRGQS